MEEIKRLGVAGTNEDEEKEFPNSLFLYRKADEFAEQIVAKQQLYFSSPLNFNDPFECSKEDAETEGKKGILCLSGVNPADNTLMWAHYADKHKGLCFEFYSKPLCYILLEDKENAIELYYNNSTTENNVVWCNIEKVEYDAANPVKLLTKDEAWKYEDEYRIIVDYENIIKKNKYQRTFKFDKSRLKKIYFGINASPDTIEKYKSLCAIHMGRQITLYKMEKQKGMQYLFQAPTPIDY